MLGARLWTGETVTHQSPDAATTSEVHSNPKLIPVEVAAVVQCNVVLRSVAHLGEQGDLFLDLSDVIVRRVEVNDLWRWALSANDVPWECADVP